MIKNWKLFIESQLDLFNPYIPGKKKEYLNIYSLKEETIIDLLYEFEDDNYHISIYYGQLNDDKGLLSSFKENINKYNFKPVTLVKIHHSNNSNMDLTKSFKNFIKRIQSSFKSIKYSSSDEVYNDLSKLDFNKKIHYNNKENDLFLFLIEDDVTITDRELFSYYDNINNDVLFNDKNQALVEVNKDDLLTFVNNEKYSEILSGDYDDDLYYDVYIDHDLILNHMIDKSNFEKIIKLGYESIKDYLDDIDDINDLFNKLKTDRWGSLIKVVGDLLYNNTEFYNEIIQIYKDMELEDFENKYYNTLKLEFENRIESELDTTIVNTYEKNGDTYYRLLFNIKWLSYSLDDDFFERDNIKESLIINLIQEYHNDYFDMNPHFENGDVNYKKYNESISQYLNKI